MPLQTQCTECGAESTQALCAACSQDKLLEQAQLENVPKGRAITGTVTAGMHIE
jgi:hypothetical protein